MKGLAEKKKAFSPSVEAPCAQFMFAVDDGSESHKAGVLANDFIYQVIYKPSHIPTGIEVFKLNTVFIYQIRDRVSIPCLIISL